MLTIDTRVQIVHLNTALNAWCQILSQMLALSNHVFKSMQYNGFFMAVQMTNFQTKYFLLLFLLKYLLWVINPSASNENPLSMFKTRNREKYMYIPKIPATVFLYIKVGFDRATFTRFHPVGMMVSPVDYLSVFRMAPKRRLLSPWPATSEEGRGGESSDPA